MLEFTSISPEEAELYIMNSVNHRDWETWQYDFKINKKLFDGCNAFRYNDTIYYQRWKNGEFKLCKTE